MQRVGTKTCTQCGAVKELDSFNRMMKSRDGRRSRCRDCTRAYNQGYRNSAEGAKKRSDCGRQRVLRDPGRLARWIAENPDKYLVSRNKAVSKYESKLSVRQRRKKYNAERNLADRESVSERYAVQLIMIATGAKVAQIPPLLIAAKRRHIILKRKIREIRDGNQDAC